MRFLCLHGMGTSGAIFRAQTAAFRNALPPDHQHTFDFINAPHPCDATRAISPFFPGPHYTFCRDYTIPEVIGAPVFVLSLLREAREAGQPYDALMCFSQGCAVAAGLLMSHRIEHPNEELPVKGVVFICGGVPLPLLQVWGLEVAKKAWEINEITGRDLQRKAARAGQEIATLMEERKEIDGKNRRPMLKRESSLWKGTESLVHQEEIGALKDPGLMPPLDAGDVYGLDLRDVPEHLVIDIPTVHVYGIKDPRYPAGIQLAWFCNAEKRRVFDTGGGHEIPRTSQASNGIADAIEWLQGMVASSGALRQC